MTTMQEIRERALSTPRGTPFTTAKLLGSGKRAAVDQAISRLIKAGEITRVARGIFVRPEKNKYLGYVMPNPAKVVELIAQNTGSIIQVHGAEAAHRLGLSTQMPIQLVFYTSGPSRHLTLGNLNLTLKHVTPRKLLLAGRPAGLAFTALWYLGKEQVSIETIKTIQKCLPAPEFKVLQNAIPFMPGWMVDVFVRFEEKKDIA